MAKFSTLAEYLEKCETQEALAARLECSQAAISKAKLYGRGSYTFLKRISKATGVPLDSFERKDAA